MSSCIIYPQVSWFSPLRTYSVLYILGPKAKASYHHMDKDIKRGSTFWDHPRTQKDFQFVSVCVWLSPQTFNGRHSQ